MIEPGRYINREMKIKKDWSWLIYCLVFSFLMVAVVAVRENEALARMVVFVTFATAAIAATHQKPKMILKVVKVEDDGSFDDLDD